MTLPVMLTVLLSLAATDTATSSFVTTKSIQSCAALGPAIAARCRHDALNVDVVGAVDVQPAHNGHIGEALQVNAGRVAAARLNSRRRAEYSTSTHQTRGSAYWRAAASPPWRCTEHTAVGCTAPLMAAVYSQRGGA